MKNNNSNQPPPHSIACSSTFCWACSLALFYLAVTSSSHAADQFVRMPNLRSNSTYSFGCAWGDYDNDGYIDLIVTNGAANGRQSMDLYHNHNDSTSPPT